MTYTEALAYIHSVSWRGSVPGLSRIRELCDKMGNPERTLRCIHIAGTNGKGSTAAYLTAVLHEAGYHVGTFTSPYVRTFNERIAIDGEPVSDYMLARAVEYVRTFAEQMTDKPTEFELITAVGFEIFKRKKCDLVVLEVGLGGRYDSTNIIETPLLSVITGIAYDHMQLLGGTLAAIASEKAGIIKANRPVCIAKLPDEAREVVLAEAAKQHAPLCEVEPEKITLRAHDLTGLTLDYKTDKHLTTMLAGLYQPRNIALVCEVVHRLEKEGLTIGSAALYAGIAKTRWCARFELLSKDPVVIFDGGHNEEGVTAAVETLRGCFNGKVNILSGVMADKAYEKMADIIAPVAAKVFTVKPDNPRALDAAALAEVYQKRGIPAEPFAGIAEGLKAARRESRAARRPLLILGSLYMYKDIYRHFHA